MQAHEAETQWAVFKENRNEMVTTFGLKPGVMNFQQFTQDVGDLSHINVNGTILPNSPPNGKVMQP